MENKHVGMIISSIAVVMGILVFVFKKTLTDFVNATCSHGPECTMYDSISLQTWISLGVVAIIFVIGLAIMFTKPKEKIVERVITKKVQEKKKPLDLSKLDGKEKALVKIIQENNGVIFQAELTEKSGLGKVGLTRLLDKLEAKQIIERKRRGMNNVVVLKG